MNLGTKADNSYVEHQETKDDTKKDKEKGMEGKDNGKKKSVIPAGKNAYFL